MGIIDRNFHLQQFNCEFTDYDKSASLVKRHSRRMLLFELVVSNYKPHPSSNLRQSSVSNLLLITWKWSSKFRVFGNRVARGGVLNRLQIQPHSIYDFLRKVRIVGDLEGIGEVRLQVVVFPHATAGVFTGCSRWLRRRISNQPFIQTVLRESRSLHAWFGGVFLNVLVVALSKCDFDFVMRSIVG